MAFEVKLKRVTLVDRVISILNNEPDLESFKIKI